MEEQRRCLRSANQAERFAAALLIPAEVSRRLRSLTDLQVGRLLEREVCTRMSLLVPELTICTEAAQRLQEPTRKDHRRAARSPGSSRQNQGEHIMHAEATLYRAGIPYLLLPFGRDRFASSTFMVSDVAGARVCLLEAGFRTTSRSPLWLIDGQTRRPIYLYEDRTRLCSTTEEGLDG